MAIEYNFKYMPLVGKLSGQSMVQQTEMAINEIAKIVNDNTAQAEIINTLAEEANANSVEALEKANEAIETSSRFYVNETAAVNLNDYCEAQLIYINNAFSQNLPVAHKGFLEVKTNDDKTQATQVFADNVDRKFYVRTGEITATEVGDVTTYTASYGEWVNIPNSTDLANYLPVAGGTMNGDIEYSTSDFTIKSNDINNDGEISVVGATDNLNGASLTLYGRNHTEVGAFELNANNGTLTKTLKGDASGDLAWDGDITADNFIGNLTGNADTATKATNDGNGNQIDTTYLPLSGGTLTGNLDTPHINLKCDFSKGTTPSATKYAAVYMSDKDGDAYAPNCIGMLESSINTANVSRTYIRALKNEAGSTVNCEISCNVDANGTIYTSAPTPAQTDDSTKIATTAYVKDCVPKSVGNSNIPVYVNSNGVVTSTGKSFANYAPIAKSVGGTQRPVYTDANGKATACTATGTNGGLEGVTTVASNYIRYVSGLQICWGETEIQTSGTTISFGAAFTAAPKIVAELQADGSSTTAWLTKIVSKSTTNFKMYVTNNSAFQQKGTMWIAIGKWK